MDLPSDSDESDVDFVPGEEEAVSEESETEADKDTDEQFEKEQILKKQKRAAKGKSNQVPRKKTRRTSRNDNDNISKEIQPITESDKKYEDDLWASFLSDPSPAKKDSVPAKSSTEKPEETKKENKIGSLLSKNDSHEKLGTVKKHEKIRDEKALFDIDIVQEEVDEDKSIEKDVKEKDEAPSSSLLGRRALPNPGGGLASILSQIGKKSKIGTLEKSKIDWNTFKKTEGIEEDIEVHNRGKDGFLERQDFLQRTDLRQFEIEKNFRTNKRSNR